MAFCQLILHMLKWIIKKYPEAAKFIWGKIGRRIDEKEPNKYLLKIRKVINDPKLILRKFGIIHYSTKLFSGMNSMNLWWEENEKLRICFDNCYKRAIISVGISEELNDSLKCLYEEGNTIEKMLVITAISAINYYFGGNTKDVN